MEKIAVLSTDLEFVIPGRRELLFAPVPVERKKAIDVIFSHIMGPRMADDFLTRVACEIRKIVVHHGDGRVLFYDNGRRAGIFEQGLIKMSRMSQLLFDLLILSGLRLKTFYFIASRFQFDNKLQPGFVSSLHCSTSGTIFFILYKNGMIVHQIALKDNISNLLPIYIVDYLLNCGIDLTGQFSLKFKI
jgi:hypothetical protein